MKMTDFMFCLLIFLPAVPEVMWSKSQYTVKESDELIEVCALVVGTINEEFEVQLSTVDFTAVGMSNDRYTL